MIGDNLNLYKGENRMNRRFLVSALKALKARVEHKFWYPPTNADKNEKYKKLNVRIKALEKKRSALYDELKKKAVEKVCSETGFRSREEALKDINQLIFDVQIAMTPQDFES